MLWQFALTKKYSYFNIVFYLRFYPFCFFIDLFIIITVGSGKEDEYS